MMKDKVYGGWYSGLPPSGEILPTKQFYAHAFVILAATSGMLAGRNGAEVLLEKALSVYDRYFWDEQASVARDTWNTEFTVLDDYRGLNANMHTVEAFLAAADATGREEYREENVRDHVNGSWLHQRDQENKVIGTVWKGKSDIYHTLQATLIPYCVPELLVAAAVKTCYTVWENNNKGREQ